MEESKQKVAVNPLEALLQAIKTVQGSEGVILPKGSLDALFPVTAGMRAAKEEARQKAEAEMQQIISQPIGTLDKTGWKYAGISPDTGKSFYVMSLDTVIINWNGVNTIVAAYHKGGKTKLRVPTESELKHIFNHRTAIGGFHVESGNPAGWYWTATAGDNSLKNQRCINFADGKAANVSKISLLPVRLVKDL